MAYGQNQMYPIAHPQGGGTGQTGGAVGGPMSGMGQMPGLLQMMMQGGGAGGGENPFSRIWGGAGQRGFGGGGGGGNPFAAIWGGEDQPRYLGYPQFQGQNAGMKNSLPPGLLQMMMQRQGQGQGGYDPSWGNTQARRAGSPADYLQRGNDWLQGGINNANAGLQSLWTGV